MTIPMILRLPSALVPVAMSLAALAVVFIHIVLHGTAREADEGTAAHLWQVLMVAQVPVIMLFATRWLPQRPKCAVAVITLQAAVAFAALLPVFLLRW